MAFTMTSSGDTLIPAKSGDAFNRFTKSMVLVASTSTNTDTWGAENMLLTIACAIAFRTPLTGIRSSLFSGHSGVSRFLNTVACPA